MLNNSGQPEILRAVQRDEAFLSQLNNSLNDILQLVLGVRNWLRISRMLKIISDISYYSLTTLSNLQTLGEEYTGILPINSSKKSLQKKHVQLLMILLNVFGEKALIDILREFEKSIKNLPLDHPLRHEARLKLLRTSIWLRMLVPYIQHFHKAIFYLNGCYYHLGKRLTSTRYILVKYWLKDKSTIPTFRYLGIISVIQLLLQLFTTFKKIKCSFSHSMQNVKAAKANDEVVINNCDKCSLCLNIRQNTSATSCGHLFCWDCIISWLQDHPQCPLCRKAVQPSRVVLLQNY